MCIRDRSKQQDFASQFDFYPEEKRKALFDTLIQAQEMCIRDRAGICRYGFFVLPMDEALILTAVDISGRECLVYDADIPAAKVGDFDTELVKEFLLAFTRNLGASVHVRQLSGENSHHIIEGMFKSLARSLRAAVSIEKGYEDEIPSTKGVI